MLTTRPVLQFLGIACAAIMAGFGACAVAVDSRAEVRDEVDGMPGDGAAPAGEEFVAGPVGWSDEVAAARPRFDSGSVTQSSNVDANRRTGDRVSITGGGDTLTVRIEGSQNEDTVTLSAADAIDTKRLRGATRRVLQTQTGSGSTAYAVTYEFDDGLADLVLGHWIIERERGQPDGGAFGESPACRLERIAQSDVLSYSGAGFGIVSVEEAADPQSTILFELEVSRFYANFGTGQVHADVLERGSGRRVILRGQMSDDRTRFRGAVSTQLASGVLVEAGSWGGIFCAQHAASTGDAAGLVITAAYEYEIDTRHVNTMAVMEAQRSTVDDQGDDRSVPSAPSFGAQRIGDQNYTKGQAIGPLVLPAASGGNGTLRYSLSEVPDGLSFLASTRTLTGTPTRSQTYAITYTVQDSDRDTDTLSFTVTVRDALPGEVSEDDDDGVADDDGSGSDDDGVRTDDDDGLADDDGSGGDDDGFDSDDDDGTGDDDGSGGDDDGFASDDDDGLGDDDGSGGDDDGFLEDDDDGVGDDDGSGGDDDGFASDDDDGSADDDGSGGDDDGLSENEDDDGSSSDDDDDDGSGDDDGDDGGGDDGDDN